MTRAQATRRHFVRSAFRALRRFQRARRAERRALLKAPHWRNRRAQRERSGVILLVVLGLMALFALVGITFVMTATQHKLSSTRQGKEEQKGDGYEVLLNLALEQVLCGSRNSISVVGPHSLLEDMYGVGDAVMAAIPNNGFVANNASYAPGGGSMVYFTNLPTAAPTAGTNPPQLPVGSLSQFNGHYSGRVITMISGPCAGLSTRITGYAVQGGNGILRMMPFPGMRYNGTGWASTATPPDPIPPCPRAGDVFIINSREFNGTGFGFDATTFAGTGLLNEQIAFRPNPRTSLYRQYLGYGPDMIAGTGDDIGNYVGANEVYDAPDYQNMALALMKPDGTVLSPSFHRPELINHLDAFPASPDPTLQRPVLLRPTPFDHPRFYQYLGVPDPTNNANQTAVQQHQLYGPWDVDNDADGRPDSVWIDIGLPVRADATGKFYKPMVAILCVDLDGRLNMNAAGAINSPTAPRTDMMQPASAYTHLQRFLVDVPLGATNAAGGLLDSRRNPYANPGTEPEDGARLHAGRGVDVSNITISGEWNDGPQNWVLMSNQEFVNLCHGVVNSGGAPSTRMVEGIFGEGHLVAAAGSNSADNMPKAGQTGVDSNYPPPPTFGVPGAAAGVFRGNQYESFSYATPFDWHGIGVVGLDYRGQPMYSVLSPRPLGFLDSLPADQRSHLLNEKAEIDLTQSGRRRYGGTAPNYISASVDNPLGLEELEGILRPFDVDTAGRTLRLPQLCPDFFRDAIKRRLATTESWQNPMVHFSATPEIWYGLNNLDSPRAPVNLTIMDLVVGKLKAVDEQRMVTRSDADLKTAMERMFNPTIQDDGIACFAPELVAGLPMNLNRPFGTQQPVAYGGTGFVTDYPVLNMKMWQNAPDPFTPGGFTDTGMTGTFWHGSTTAANNPRIGGAGGPHAARHRLAKQLFCLMMLVKPWSYADGQSSAEASLTAPADLKELTIRRIAQWAVNAVDFRDADSIMTPFEYDVDPFNDNGWAVDGNPHTDDAATANGDRRVVWGAEAPELMLTESFAFHDRRTADTQLETTATGPGGEAPMKRTNDMPDATKDSDYDQICLPRSGLYFELYCPRSPHSIAKPAELYNGNALELTRMAGPNRNGANPIWRVVVSKPGQGGTAAVARNNVRNRASTFPLSASLEPEQRAGSNDNFSLLSTAAGAQAESVQIDRIVWFAHNGGTVPVATNTAIANPELVYFNRTQADIGLLPGQYAVVGPHVTDGKTDTYIPQAIGTAPTYCGFMDLGTIANSRTGNAAATVNPYDQQGTHIQPPVMIACAGGNSADHTNGAAIRIAPPLSISDPLFTIPASRPNSWYPLGGLGEMAPDSTSITYPDGTTREVFDKFTVPPDEPFDKQARDGGAVPWNNSLLGQENLISTGTNLNYKTLFLQRLADPTQEWNVPGAPNYNAALPLNPYITVDWLPVDLTVFNSQPLDAGTVTDDPQDMNPGATSFRGRERGQNGGGAFPGTSDNWIFWTPISEDPQATGGTAKPYTIGSEHTLGYLNTTFNPRWTTATMPAAPSALYVGDSQHAYPWLTWQDRPYASPAELLLVPAAGAARLLQDFTVRRTNGPPNSNTHYTERSTDADRPGQAYGHLLNFFHSEMLAGPPTGMSAPAATAPDYHRLLSMVRVPPRFSGCETVLNPNGANGFSFNGAADNYPFFAPDNYVSNYREPGLVNINSIADDTGTIWTGMVNRYSPYSPQVAPPLGLTDGRSATWWTSKIQLSRLGHTTTTFVGLPPTVGAASVQLPTWFARPFTPTIESYFVPLAELRQHNGQNLAAVDGWLLRRDPNTIGGGAPLTTAEPLFAFENSAFPYVTASNATTFQTTGPYNDTKRNAYFRFEPLQKINNLVTCRSNCYAVWITVGYFEVQTAAANEGRPDGYEILEEMGAETGEIERHRAFYIIDRSIPVAFERGVRHNALETVRLQRIIE